MCGRYFLTSAPKDIRSGYFPDDFSETRINPLLEKPRYNIAPTQLAPILRRINGELVGTQVRWGFCPQWMKDRSRYQINARAETIFEKPMFKSASRSTRCIVPASGWYEWQRMPDGKQPYAFHMPNYAAFGLAGLWTAGRDAEGKLQENFLILTTDANAVSQPIHNRMPVILTPEGCTEWLDPAMQSPEQLARYLVPYAGGDLQADKVSRRVNSPNNDDEGCIEPLTAEG